MMGFWADFVAGITGEGVLVGFVLGLLWVLALHFLKPEGKSW